MSWIPRSAASLSAASLTATRIAASANSVNATSVIWGTGGILAAAGAQLASETSSAVLSGDK